MKYSIGDIVYWVYSSTHYEHSIPCEMCFGKRVVKIILGNDEVVTSECGACSHGMDYATGTMKTWKPIAIVHTGRITGVSTYGGTRYEVDGRSVSEHELFSNKEEAEKVREIKLQEAVAQANTNFQNKLNNCKKSQIWSTHYHRSRIEDAKRTIEWHQNRLAMIKERT